MNEGPMFVSRTGEPMELLDWAQHFEDSEYRIVAVDVNDPDDLHVMVSTIWEGITDFGHIFETAVLRDGTIIEQHSMSSEPEAREFHAATCRRVLGREPDPDDGYKNRIVEADKNTREHGNG